MLPLYQLWAEFPVYSVQQYERRSWRHDSGEVYDRYDRSSGFKIFKRSFPVLCTFASHRLKAKWNQQICLLPCVENTAKSNSPQSQDPLWNWRSTAPTCQERETVIDLEAGGVSNHLPRGQPVQVIQVRIILMPWEILRERILVFFLSLGDFFWVWKITVLVCWGWSGTRQSNNGMFFASFTLTAGWFRRLDCNKYYCTYVNHVIWHL